MNNTNICFILLSIILSNLIVGYFVINHEEKLSNQLDFKYIKVFFFIGIMFWLGIKTLQEIYVFIIEK
jgi:hypothetical protein